MISILNQTYQDFEIIIVDDGSTDNTKEIAKQYLKNNSDKSLRYIFQENRGSGSARNRGIKEAKGEYVAFIDADDLWLPTKLLAQVSVLTKGTSTSEPE